MDYKNITPWNQHFFHLELHSLDQNKQIICQRLMRIFRYSSLPDGHIHVAQLSKGVISLPPGISNVHSFTQNKCEPLRIP